MTRPIPTITAAEKLMLLRLPAVLRLFTSHLQIRATREALDHEELTKAAHLLLDMASEAERAQKRKERLAA